MNDIGPEINWEGKNKGLQIHANSTLQIHQKVYAHPQYSEELQLDFLETVQDCNDIPLNRFFWGDNQSLMLTLLQQGYAEKIKLIYIDPPYWSQSNYQSEIICDSGKKVKREAFDDRWGNDLQDYLNMLYPRLILMRDLLNEEGSIFVHVDWHSSHYVRLLLDEIFGRKNFINEIVWCYGGGANAKKHFLRKHDLIYWYGKTDHYTYHPQYRPYSAGTLQRGLTQVKGSQYKLREEGAVMQDWWTDLNKILSPTAYENLKYPTQKPAALIRRIVNAASNPGDLVADFFAGSGTTAEVCNELGRNWILSDLSHLSEQTVLYRLLRSHSRPFNIERADLFQSEGQLDVHALLLPDKEGQNFVEISILSYLPASDSCPLCGAELAENIEFWEIDLNYDGHFFCSRIQIMREKSRFIGPISLRIVLPIAKPSTCIAVRIHDINAREATTSILIA